MPKTYLRAIDFCGVDCYTEQVNTHDIRQVVEQAVRIGKERSNISQIYAKRDNILNYAEVLVWERK